MRRIVGVVGAAIALAMLPGCDGGGGSSGPEKAVEAPPPPGDLKGMFQKPAKMPPQNSSGPSHPPGPGG